MKYKSKYIKSGVSLALTAMMVTPTTAAFAAPIQEVNQDIKNENIPYNVLNQKTLSNPTSTAKPAKDPTKVYTSFTQSVSSNTGDGSAQRPYNRFEDAIAQVANGGTIYIDASKGAFLNAQDEYGHLPFLIDKKVTIKPVNGASNAELSVRAGGIILGADVTFENITLSFANKYHDSIYANGHTLDLINVTRGSGTRKIDVFAGGLYERKNNVDSTTPIYPSGNKGVINIETNDNFGSTTYMSTFGNIYAGSMNGTFNGSAEINISNIGKHKKLDIGAIKASGALEADAGNMFDLTEPSAPAENPEEYPTTGDVTINLHNYQVSVDGETGSESKTSVTTSTVYPSDLELENVDHLTINGGTVKAVYPESSTGVTSIPKVTINNEATLDLTKAGDSITIEDYIGDGYVTLSKTGKLDITGKVEGTLNLQTDGAFNGKSGLVTPDHVYLTTPSVGDNIKFKPHSTQWYLELNNEKVDSSVNWKLVVDKRVNTSLPPLTNLSIDADNAKVVKTYAELNPNLIDGKKDYQSVNFPFTSTIEFPPDDEYQSADLNEYPFEITINGIKAEYREDEGIFIGCHHYFVEELNLALFFTVSDGGLVDNLTVHGFTKDFNLTGIDAGNYEFEVAYAKADGTLTGFTATLSVTDDVQQDDTKTGTSSIVSEDIGNLALGGTVDIPVSIMHEDNTKSDDGATETGTAYLYVNGQKVAEQEVTPSSKSDITFEDVTINASNNFKLGNNDILITYSGTDTYNGSLESVSVGVIKATPEVTLNSELQSSYSFDYDGSAKGIGMGLKNKVNVTLNGVALSDYEEKVMYQNTSINSEFTEELPFLPGEYKTQVVVSEGDTYESTVIDGPTLTINKVQPKIKVSGKVENGNLTVTAQVRSTSQAIPPSGSVKFIVDDEDKATFKLTNGVASYTLEGLIGNTKTSSEGDGFVTPEVKVVYVDDMIINSNGNTTLYEGAESTPIEFKVASNWVSVTGVSLSEDAYNLKINGKTKLSATINEDATNKDVLWSIGNSDIAEISKDGVVTGISEGETYVTVMTVDGGYEATAIIRVSDKVDEPSGGGDGEGSTGGNGSTGGSAGGNGSTGGSNTGGSGSTGNGSSGGTGGNGSTDSDTNNNGDSNNGVENANKPENKFKVNLEGLDEELKAKVDSLITSVTSVIAESQKELMLSLDGDQEDLQHVTDVVVNKQGIFITVGNEQVKVTDKLPTADIDFTNARVVRLVDNKFIPVMHYTNGEGLRITSGNINDLIITSKVKEPFTDVKDDAWYHDDVEEIFNYGFTQGTTATTYSPNNGITRGEFVVMIARALELQPSSETSKFKDIDGKWYQNEAQALYELGIIKGNTDGMFGGDNKITRQEAATFITRMLSHMNVNITVGNTVEFIDKHAISTFANDSVQYLASQGVLVGGGDNKFNPTNNLTRAEMAKILVRSLKLSNWY